MLAVACYFLFAVNRSVFVECCLLFVFTVCYLLRGMCCLLSIDRALSTVACDALFTMCCLLLDICCLLLIGRCLSVVACCSLVIDCYLLLPTIWSLFVDCCCCLMFAA